MIYLYLVRERREHKNKTEGMVENIKESNKNIFNYWNVYCIILNIKILFSYI